MKELNTIIEIVNQISGIDIKEQKRESHYVYSRAVYYKLARMHTNLTLSEIAKKSGRGFPPLLPVFVI